MAKYIVEINDSTLIYSENSNIEQVCFDLLQRHFVFGIELSGEPTDYGEIEYWIVNEKKERIGKIELIYENKEEKD